MDIVILGRIGYDLYSEEPHVPLPQVRRFSRYLGGSSANMAVGLARLGASVGIVGCLGNDSLSQFLLEFLEAGKGGHQPRADRSRDTCRRWPSPKSRRPTASPRCSTATIRRTPCCDVSEADLDYVAASRMFVTNGTSLVRVAVARIHVPRPRTRPGGGLPRRLRRRLPGHVLEQPGRGRTGGAAGAAVRRCADRQPAGVDACRRSRRSRSRYRQAALPRADARIEAGRTWAPASGPAANRSSCRRIPWKWCRRSAPATVSRPASSTRSSRG